MVGSPFIANRRRGHQQLARRDRAVQDTGAAAGHELAAAKRDDFLEKRRRQRSAHAGVKQRQPLVFAFDSEDQVRAHCAFQGVTLVRPARLMQFVNFIVEKTDNTMFGQVLRLPAVVRRCDGVGVWVELKDWVGLAHQERD